MSKSFNFPFTIREELLSSARNNRHPNSIAAVNKPRHAVNWDKPWSFIEFGLGDFLSINHKLWLFRLRSDFERFGFQIFGTKALQSWGRPPCSLGAVNIRAWSWHHPLSSGLVRAVHHHHCKILTQLSCSHSM